jgi:hypothetical protein
MAAISTIASGFAREALFVRVALTVALAGASRGRKLASFNGDKYKIVPLLVHFPKEAGAEI